MKKLVFPGAFFLCLACIQAAVVPSAQRGPALQKLHESYAKSADLHSDIVYKKIGEWDVTLDLMLPRRTKNKYGEPLFKDGAPVVFYLHGGGWINGNRYTSAQAVEFFSERGIASVGVSYRFSKDGDTLETCVTDCFDAVRFIAKNAEKYNLDPNRFLAYGASAGGHLTLMMLTAEAKDFPGDPTLADAAFKFIGGVAMCPPTTLVDAEAWNGEDYINVGRLEKLLNCSGEPMWALAKKLSPLHLLKKDSPRILIVHGEDDKTVSIEGSILMVKKAEQIGADVQLVRAPGAGHNFKGKHPPLWRVQRLIFLENLWEMARSSYGQNTWENAPQL